MAGAKEIRSKIASVQNTQKITKAMEMVAASKMRKSQERMAASRPYAETMRSVIGHLALGNLEYKHPYLEERDVKRVGYLVVSTDRGLCGGLNINLFKRLLAEMKGWSEKGVECDLALIGSKAASFFGSVGGKIVAQVTGMGDNPSLSELIGPVKVMLQAYDEGRLDKLYIVNNKFINTMSQEPRIMQLLPLPPAEDAGAGGGHSEDRGDAPVPGRCHCPAGRHPGDEREVRRPAHHHHVHGGRGGQPPVRGGIRFRYDLRKPRRCQRPRSGAAGCGQ